MSHKGNRFRVHKNPCEHKRDIQLYYHLRLL